MHTRHAELTKFENPYKLQILVESIHAYMSEDKSVLKAGEVQTNLEKLYDIFIRPIADLLACMSKPEDNLVFALDEVGT